MIRRPRANFSKETKRLAYVRSKGICECHRIPHVFKVVCGCRLGPGNTFYEHVDPDAISGRSDLDNAAVLTKTCCSYKTSTYDIPTVRRVFLQNLKDGAFLLDTCDHSGSRLE